MLLAAARAVCAPGAGNQTLARHGGQPSLGVAVEYGLRLDGLVCHYQRWLNDVTWMSPYPKHRVKDARAQVPLRANPPRPRRL